MRIGAWKRPTEAAPRKPPSRVNSPGTRQRSSIGWPCAAKVRASHRRSPAVTVTAASGTLTSQKSFTIVAVRLMHVIHRLIVALCALDNLMKGAAGTAVQCLNLMHGWPEQTGLRLIGLHPV